MSVTCRLCDAEKLKLFTDGDDSESKKSNEAMVAFILVSAGVSVWRDCRIWSQAVVWNLA